MYFIIAVNNIYGAYMNCGTRENQKQKQKKKDEKGRNFWFCNFEHHSCSQGILSLEKPNAYLVLVIYEAVLN